MSLLPYAMRDLNNLALENCMKQIFDIDPKRIMINPLENVNEKLLPYLADEYHIKGVEGWNFAISTEQKRNLIVKSLINHAKKGAIPTIEGALNNIGFESKIYEFWQYGGRPAHFAVKFLNLKDCGLDNELENNVKQTISAYAPKSRILDFIRYFLCSAGLIYKAARVKTKEKVILATREVIL